MTEADRQHLRTIVGVALALAGRQLLRQLAEKPTGISEPARIELSRRIAAEVEQQFELVRKPAWVPPPAVQGG